MSERCIICSDYIYCKDCINILKEIFEEHYHSTGINGRCGYLHIIYHGIYNEECFYLCESIFDAIVLKICHTIRLIIFSESAGTRLYILSPDKWETHYTLNCLHDLNLYITRSDDDNTGTKE